MFIQVFGSEVCLLYIVSTVEYNMEVPQALNILYFYLLDFSDLINNI